MLVERLANLNLLAVSNSQETAQSVNSLFSLDFHSFPCFCNSFRSKPAKNTWKMRKGEIEKAEIITNPRTPWRCRRRFGPKRQHVTGRAMASSKSQMHLLQTWTSESIQKQSLPVRTLANNQPYRLDTWLLRGHRYHVSLWPSWFNNVQKCLIL